MNALTAVAWILWANVYGLAAWLAVHAWPHD